MKKKRTGGGPIVKVRFSPLSSRPRVVPVPGSFAALYYEEGLEAIPGPPPSRHIQVYLGAPSPGAIGQFGGRFRLTSAVGQHWERARSDRLWLALSPSGAACPVGVGPRGPTGRSLDGYPERTNN